MHQVGKLRNVSRLERAVDRPPRLALQSKQNAVHSVDDSGDDLLDDLWLLVRAAFVKLLLVQLRRGVGVRTSGSSCRGYSFTLTFFSKFAKKLQTTVTVASEAPSPVPKPSSLFVIARISFAPTSSSWRPTP